MLLFRIILSSKSQGSSFLSPSISLGHIGVYINSTRLRGPFEVARTGKFFGKNP